jgi:hypothetical protein
MTIDIRDVLNRRSDLSTFVVHLTRDGGDGPTAAENLRSIITGHRIEARRPMGWAATQDSANAAEQSQRVACFSETPLEQIYSLLADIADRQIKLAPYGLALTKLAARRLGVNPVWYVDMTPGQTRNWAVAKAVDGLRAAAIATGHFHTSLEAEVFPFFEQMGTWPQSRKEFWWEREWRHRGHFEFEPWEIALWLCPEDEIEAFRALAVAALRQREAEWAQRKWEPPKHGEPALIDPRWGLEQIVAHLAGHGADVTPFGPR